METSEQVPRTELLSASDASIRTAVESADPMVLRGLLYQLTGDASLKEIATTTAMLGVLERKVPARAEDIAMLRHKATEFLIAYRDGGAGPIDPGPLERLDDSIALVVDEPVEEDLRVVLREELALDPWARELKWRDQPDQDRLGSFSVAVVGTGIGGLNAAVQLKRAGIDFTVYEKNRDVGGTWADNRYPGARVDTPSRLYAHLYGLGFPADYTYGPQSQIQDYLSWVCDEFELRSKIAFQTRVAELAWDEASRLWEITIVDADGTRVERANAVIMAVGYLSQPNIPDIKGAETFGGPSWHTARWPEGVDLSDKQVAVVGSGCTGYQMVPELLRQVGGVTLFQRTPQWVLPIPGYLSRESEQVLWLDRNFPYHANFMRLNMYFGYNEWYFDATTIDPDFDDPHSCNAVGKAIRDHSLAVLADKLKDPELVEAMTPKHPVWSARPVLCDAGYSILDVLTSDQLTLVTEGVAEIDAEGIRSAGGNHYDVDAIVYATGFRANDYLHPITIRGRDGVTTEKLWAEDGPRSYVGGMLAGFPNLWTVYGPNTNGGLQVPTFHEYTALYALRCIEELILTDKHSVEVTSQAYLRHSQMLDERNQGKVWSDKRAHNYFWTDRGRSAGMNPLSSLETIDFLRAPQFDDMIFDG